MPLAKKIADRLFVPATTQAILWDMDGVLIDSLGFDLNICNQLLHQHLDEQIQVTPELIRALFAYDPRKFWDLILDFVAEHYQMTKTSTLLETLLADFTQARQHSTFELNPGIAEILTALQAQSLKTAVVSNNPTTDVEAILTRCGIVHYFDHIIGNDRHQHAKKPAADTYLWAAEQLNVAPTACVVIEDSLVGVEAGYRAGGHTIGVATGGTDFEALAQSQYTHQVYSSFKINQFNFQFGDIRQKNIITPNDFVSHMLEHIAWRLGIRLDLYWYNNDWWQLGYFVGQQLSQIERQAHSAVALGMIDDGSAEVMLTVTQSPYLNLTAIEPVDLNWFLSLRCEQLHSAKPLVRLLQGLIQGLGLYLTIKVCSVEDPHHTWEGIFRALGIALSQLFTPKPLLSYESSTPEHQVSEGELSVLTRSTDYCQVIRGTAESYVKVSVDLTQTMPNQFNFQVAPSIKVDELSRLLTLLADAAQLSIQVEFKATVLSSSHVVLEDTGLVLGRALLEILTLRMHYWGVNGAGSSLTTIEDVTYQAIRVGISVEGRKFWKFVPFHGSAEQLKTEFIIGHSVYHQLHSEDLDDFLDGLAGGLSCSIIVHIQELLEPHIGWPLLFQQLGKALAQVFTVNPYRRGVPPGVKATLS